MHMKRILATILLSFVLAFLNCTEISAQQIVSTNVKVEQLTTEMEQQKATIQQLQSENHDLAKQVESLSGVKEELLRDNTRLRDDMSHWLNVIAIIFTLAGVLLGVAVPLITRKDIKGILDVRIKEVADKAKNADDALNETKVLKKEISEIKSKIEQDSKKAAESAKEAKASQLFAEALSEKDPRKAITLYDEVIKLAPNSSHAYNNRGILKENLGDKDGALKDYDKSIKLDSNLAEAYNNRGVLEASKDDNEGALKDFDKSIGLKPDYAEAYSNRGLLKTKMDDMYGALRDFDRAIEQKSDYAEAYSNRGNLKYKMGDKKGAIKDYDKAIKLNPDYAALYNNRGVTKASLKDYKGAEADIKRAIELNSSDPGYYMFFAELNEAMAEAEQDEAKKKEYLSEAAGAKAKAEELKKKDNH